MGWTVWGMIPGRSKKFFSSLKCPDWLWGSPGVPFSGPWRVKQPQSEADHLPTSSTEVLRVSGALCPLPLCALMVCTGTSSSPLPLCMLVHKYVVIYLVTLSACILHSVSRRWIKEQTKVLREKFVPVVARTPHVSHVPLWD